MPNVTISVSDELKAEMDRLLEVSWSEICRKAIVKYIDERKYANPNIELDLSDVRLDPESYQTGYPALFVTLRIHNKMESEITIDRILFSARFITSQYQYTIGSSFDLFKRTIAPNSIGAAQISLTLHKEKIESLKDAFTSTFYCNLNCTVFAEGFRNPYIQEVRTRIPIDDWKELAKNLLKTLQFG